ncbi:MAG: TolC family protein [Prevotella sp.]|nr:TolC family protein [Prevotella sp.]
MNKIFSILLFFAILPVQESVQAETANNCNEQIKKLSLTVKQADAMFIAGNLSLIAKHYDIDEAKAQMVQARLFDNPTIELSENIYNRLNRRYFDFGRQSEQEVSVEQAISIAGKRKNGLKVALAEKKIAECEFEEMVRTLKNEMHNVFIDTYYLQKKVRLYDEQIRSVSKLLLSMKEQENKGNIPRMEYMRMKSLCISLKKEKNEILISLHDNEAQLRNFLGIGKDIEMKTIVQDNDLIRMGVQRVAITHNIITAPNRSDIRLAEACMKRTEADLKLQHSLAAPDLSLKVSYDRQGNFIPNYFAVGIGLSIPVFNRNQGNIKAAKAAVVREKTELDAVINKRDIEVESALAVFDESMKLYDESRNADFAEMKTLIDGVTENFKKRNISMTEFIDYYQSYRETLMLNYDVCHDVISAAENVNNKLGYEAISF